MDPLTLLVLSSLFAVGASQSSAPPPPQMPPQVPQWPPMTPQRLWALAQLCALSQEQLFAVDTAELDRAAWGLSSEEAVELPLDRIEIRYRTDDAAAREEVAAQPRRWRPYLGEPLEVSLRGGRYYLEDGHHRYHTALRLGLHALPAVVKPDDNPVVAIQALCAALPPELKARAAEAARAQQAAVQAAALGVALRSPLRAALAALPPGYDPQVRLEMRCADDRGGSYKPEAERSDWDQEGVEDYEETRAAQHRFESIAREADIHVEVVDSDDRASRHTDAYATFPLSRIYEVMSAAEQADLSGDVLDVPEDMPESVIRAVERELLLLVEFGI